MPKDQNHKPGENKFTVLFATPELKALGFTHLVANLETKQIVGAFYSEWCATVSSDAMNEKV
jgi:hypothetical protein